MAIRDVFVLWDGPERDILSLLPEPWHGDFDADPDEDDIRIALYRRLDENDEANGEVVGVQILDFLSFDRWHAFSDVPDLWQVERGEPLPLHDLLQRLQARLREPSEVTAHA